MDEAPATAPAGKGLAGWIGGEGRRYVPIFGRVRHHESRLAIFLSAFGCSNSYIYYTNKVRFEDLLSAVGNHSVFSTDVVAKLAANPATLRNQLGSWTRTGKVVQLRRGVYALNKPYRPDPAPEIVATFVFNPSYVSLESALSHYSMIPEWVPVTTVVTTGRPCKRRITSFGVLIAQHIKPEFFWGFSKQMVSTGEMALIADREKALLDLIYLKKGGDTAGFLKELRLQNLEEFDLAKFVEMAERSGSPKLNRAARLLIPLAVKEMTGWYEHVNGQRIPIPPPRCPKCSEQLGQGCNVFDCKLKRSLTASPLDRG